MTDSDYIGFVVLALEHYLNNLNTGLVDLTVLS